MTDRKLSVCLWCGPICLVIFASGMLLAGYFPPPSPADSATEITAWYRDNLTAIRAGIVLMMIAAPFILPWSIAVISQARRAERGWPVLTVISAACAGIVLFTIVLIVLIWGVTAFRPGDLSPEITQTLNDAAFFMLLFDFGPYCLWCVCLAATILLDTSEQPVFARWAGFLNIWVVIASIPAVLLIFFKHGPLAYNGLLGFYFPVVVFFAWIVVMTILTRQAVQRLASDARATPASPR